MLRVPGASLVADALFTAPVSAQSPEVDDPGARIEALEARIARLEAEASGAAALARTRDDEIRALVRNMLADADARASLLQGGATIPTRATTSTSSWP